VTSRAVVTTYRDDKIRCSHFARIIILESISHFEAPFALTLTSDTAAPALRAQNRST
jgi:hypothetical protein